MNKVKFDKVELAKMIGLQTAGYPRVISKWTILNLIEDEYCIISEIFCGGIEVVVAQGDLAKDKLDITKGDLVDEGDIRVCCKQVEDLLWQRAADEYLARVHNTAMVIGKG